MLLSSFASGTSFFINLFSDYVSLTVYLCKLLRDIILLWTILLDTAFFIWNSGYGQLVAIPKSCFQFFTATHSTNLSSSHDNLCEYYGSVLLFELIAYSFSHTSLLQRASASSIECVVNNRELDLQKGNKNVRDHNLNW